MVSWSASPGSSFYRTCQLLKTSSERENEDKTGLARQFGDITYVRVVYSVLPLMFVLNVCMIHISVFMSYITELLEKPLEEKLMD